MARAASKIQKPHTQLISLNVINAASENAASQVGEAPGDAEIRHLKTKKKRRRPSCPCLSSDLNDQGTLEDAVFLTGAASAELSHSWQGAWQQMVVAAKLKMRPLGGRRRGACFH